MNELNKKLAEWAGFKLVKTRKKIGIPTYPQPFVYNTPQWYDPDGNPLPDGIMLIDFTSSLDACFKWLVPKFDWFILSSGFMGDLFTAEVRSYPQRGIDYKYGFAEAETPALALCKAIEQLIDKEEQ